MWVMLRAVRNYQAEKVHGEFQEEEAANRVILGSLNENMRGCLHFKLRIQQHPGQVTNVNPGKSRAAHHTKNNT